MGLPQPAMSHNLDWPLQWLHDQLAYEPRDAALFAAALTHRSAPGDNNERLEFLGDAVLNLLIAQQLYVQFPDADEGSLSRLRSRLVSTEPLAEAAAGLQLGSVLALGSGELKSGGFRRESILADGLEALIGAVYLDRGIEAARDLIARLFTARIAALPDPETLKDPKTQLQELLQGRGLPLPQYITERIEGEAHARSFQVTCRVESPDTQARGEGSSRRRAEQAAARAVLERLQ